MHFLVDYIEPLTAWLQHHPIFALLITAFVSFTESLAIVGSIVPGSLTMTAIGILAGSGVMRIDLTLIAASIGAIAGDGASYILGYVYSDRLTQIWPFRKYPSLIFYGKDFFNKHGGKSVVIGRFFGPLRSIIPVIAGIMNMPKMLFFIANAISAVGWSVLYIMPGYLVGAASNQLSSEGARRLFMLIILSLLFIWITTKLVRLIIQSTTRWYNNNLDAIYSWLIQHPYLKLLFKDNAKATSLDGLTITLIIGWIACFTLTIFISLFVLQNTWINGLNSSIAFFLQGIRTKHIDTLLTIINLITSPVPLLSVFTTVIFASVVSRDFRLFRYLLSLALSSILVVYIFSSHIDVPNASKIYQLYIDATYPVISLTWATALFSFCIYYLLQFYRRNISLYLLRVCLIIILFLSGVQTIFLGDNWLTSVITSYLIGLCIAIFHWVMYQRRDMQKHKVNLTITIVLVCICATTWFEFNAQGENISKNHSINIKQHSLTETTWWEQTDPILPIYTTNRIGKQIGLFNLQYLGSLKELESRLSKLGWSRKLSSVFYSLMFRLDGKHSDVKMPIMEQLYLNKRPELIMVFNHNTNKDSYILRLWRSNYSIEGYTHPLWIGSIILAINIDGNTETRKELSIDEEKYIFSPLLDAITHYRILDLKINNNAKYFRKVNNPHLLIFKIKDTSNY